MQCIFSKLFYILVYFEINFNETFPKSKLIWRQNKMFKLEYLVINTNIFSLIV